MSPGIDAFSEFVANARALTVLTGAGASTGSGIPDYRDRNGDSKIKKPIQYQEFVGQNESRQRYWARSFVGWQRFSKAEPNTAHVALAKLETAGKIDTLITQNVDGLHRQAGSRSVIDLHGDLSQVVCVQCHHRSSRAEYQQRLQEANIDWHAQVFKFNPDGDAEVAEADLSFFMVPDCDRCDGLIKPDVVMFGESVPRQRVADASSAVERSDGLLIVGSSLMVYSGFRFARQAHSLQKPIVVINQGRTRADDLASLKIDADCQEVLSSFSIESISPILA